MGEIPHVQDPVVEYARECGWLVRRVQYIGRTGCPDTICIRGGRVIWIEFKDLGEPPNAIQLREHRRLRKRGAELYVIDSAEEGRALFDRIDLEDA